MTKPAKAYALDELNLETTFGGIGRTKEREVPRIDMSHFEKRKAEIADQLWDASTRIGFFQLVNHGIPQEQIEEAFEMTERFFALPHETKARMPMLKGTNAGWEYRSQVRPSTGTADNKESYQLTPPRMAKLWPGDDLPGFKMVMLAFERANWALGMKVLSAFALKLGFTPDFFTEAHDPLAPDYQSTLRLLHYLPMENAKPEDFTGWRAGAHTDYDCLTLLHQRTGQGGLQLCPGKEASGELEWTDVEPLPGVITCNIGDMLKRWSDDQLQSTLHRVRMPRADEYLGPRYSLPFFCQANMNSLVQGPQKKYAPITAHEFLQQRIAANFATMG
jgi:isopenicillin N synthase-like dioxygenase